MSRKKSYKSKRPKKKFDVVPKPKPIFFKRENEDQYCGYNAICNLLVKAICTKKDVDGVINSQSTIERRQVGVPGTGLLHISVVNSLLFTYTCYQPLLINKEKEMTVQDAFNYMSTNTNNHTMFIVFGWKPGKSVGHYIAVRDNNIINDVHCDSRKDYNCVELTFNHLGNALFGTKSTRIYLYAVVPKLGSGKMFKSKTTFKNYTRKRKQKERKKRYKKVVNVNN